MNIRVLELLKNPEFLQAEDLKLLNDQIKSTPYVQNIRALFLLGTSRFDPENYKQVLSTTAAYTTDKKILYQLINGKATPQPEVIVTEPEADAVSDEEEIKEIQSEVALPGAVKTDIAATENLSPEKFTEITPSESAVPKPVYVNGELNRILFEGEENFLEQETISIDKEASEESGQLILADPKLSPPKIFSEESAPVSELAAKHENKEVTQESPQETMPADDMPVAKTVDATEIDSEETSAGDVSFHGIAPFLPEVKMAAAPQKVEKVVAPAPPSNKHEEEMQRLIAEVERKIKEKKAVQIISEPVEPEEPAGSDISFNDTQEFSIHKETEAKPSSEVEDTKSKDIEETEVFLRETQSPEVEQTIVSTEENDEIETASETPRSESGWKPMNVTFNIPDALLAAEPKPGDSTLPSALGSTAESATSLKPAADTVPDHVDSVISEANNESETDSAENRVLEDSNVPQFINTWQNWLKIDRSPQALPVIPEEPEEDRKTVIIEKFIETAPRISQLREDGNFAVKEKKGDISHLMTETLANIYVEQKLYAKAIHAFHILAEKHPHKADYFAGKVKEVRDLRSKIQ